MTGLSFQLANNAAELGRHKYNAFLGDTIVEVADYGNSNIDPYGIEGWYVIGRCLNLGANTAPEYYDIRTGSPETYKGSVIVGMDLQYQTVFDMPTLTGFELMNGNNLAYEKNVAADGQTTISSATRTSGTVASASNLAVGDLVEIDLSYGANASYGTYKAMAFIVSISSTTVTYTRIPQVPANGAGFLKIKGWPATSDAGFEFYMGGAQTRDVQLRVTTFNTANRSMIITYHSQVTVKEGQFFSNDDRKSPITGGINFHVIPTYSTLADVNGVSTEQPVLGKRIILPYES